MSDNEREITIPEEIKGERLLKECSYEKAAEFFQAAAENHPSEQGRLYHRAAVACWKAGVFEKAVRAFKAAIKFYHREEDSSNEARNILGLGASYHGLNRISEAYRIMHDALEIAEESGDLKAVTDALNWLGIICKEQADFTHSVEYHKRALAISRECGSEIDEASSLNSLGLTCYHMENYTKALEHFTEALAIQRTIEDSWGMPDTLSNTGMVLRKMGKLEESLEYYREALIARNKAGGKARKANILNNLGNLYLSLGNLDQAIKHHREALAIREEITSRSGMASSLLNLGEAWKKSGKLHKSASSLEKSLRYQQNNKPDEMMMDTIRMLAEVKNGLGDTERAFELSMQALEMSRILYRDQVEKRLMESREILETEHRVREAKLLRSKNRKLENLSDMLSAQKEQLQLILDYVPALIVFMNNEGIVIRLNSYAARLFSREPAELVGCVAEELFGSMGQVLEDFHELVEGEISEPLLNSIEHLTLKDGDRIFLCHRVPFKGVESTPDGMVVFALDITDERTAEEQKDELRKLADKAKRLESLGYLAGSIAHDFNNLLLGIIGNVELVLGRTTDAQSKSNLDKASTDAKRAASLCSQLLAFSGGGNFVSKRIDLSSEIRFILNSLSFDSEVHFGFSMDLADEIPMIDISPSQLRLALKSLLAVLDEGIADGDPVYISTGRINADRAYLDGVLHDTDSSEGEYVFCELGSPTGNLEDLDRMLDPFTSADVLKTDLRMPAVHGILKSYGGFMTCRQLKPSGGSIRLHFPSVPSHTAEE